MKRILLLFFMLPLFTLAQAQSYECLVGVYAGTVTDKYGNVYGSSSFPAQLGIDYNYTYQENSGQYMNFAAYPNSGEVIHYDPVNDSIAFRYTLSVTQGIVTKITVGFKIETLSADSLVLRNDFLFCEYGRTTPVDNNCQGMGTTVGLWDAFNISPKAELLEVYNIHGQRIHPDRIREHQNQLLIFIYSDGSREKRIIHP